LRGSQYSVPTAKVPDSSRAQPPALVHRGRSDSEEVHAHIAHVSADAARTSPERTERSGATSHRRSGRGGALGTDAGMWLPDPSFSALPRRDRRPRKAGATGSPVGVDRPTRPFRWFFLLPLPTATLSFIVRSFVRPPNRGPWRIRTVCSRLLSCPSVA
jgi:hypothetical protein